MPLVSVIVPMYGVERYLPDTISSLQRQTLQDLQIVLVDDDSPDGSAQIALEAQAEDSRIHYVHQQNRGPGPGGGRNGGLATANGQYVIFVDGDDVMTPDALERMATAAQFADADLVTCNATRLVGGSVRRSEFHDIGHRENVARTTAAESPWLMYDATPWNKMFRRSFFDDVVGEWPEKILYEDIAAMTRAHLLSTATAVIRDDFYYWRIRSDGQITQTTKSIDGDRQQLRELRRGADHVKQHGNDELLDWYSWKAFGFDLHWMTRKLALIDSESASVLADDILATANSLSQRAFDRLPEHAQANFTSLQGEKSRAWRARQLAVNGRLAPVSRGYDVPGVDPRATLMRWTDNDDSIVITVRVDDNAGQKWMLDAGPHGLLTGPNAEVAASVAGTTRSSRLRGRALIDFRVPFDHELFSLGHDFIHLAVRKADSSMRGEIGRSLQDRIAGRVTDTERGVQLQAAYISPYFDNNRLALAHTADDAGIVSVTIDAGRLVVELAPQTATEFAFLGLFSNHRHDHVELESIGSCCWRIDVSELVELFEAGYDLFTIAGGHYVSPAVTARLTGHASAACRSDEVQVLVGSYGQVFVQPARTLMRQLGPLLKYVRRERHVPGL